MVAVGFARLRGLFRSGINFASYEKILQNSNNRVVGNLPDDLLGKLLQANPATKKQAIKGVQSAIDDAANSLGGINKLETQAINRTNLLDKRSMERMGRYVERTKDFRYYREDPLYAEQELKAIIKAEESLLKGLKTCLPETKNVVIKPLGSGQFGHAYKIEVLGDNSQKIISDKVIKLYREEPLMNKMLNKLKSTIDTKSDQELLKLLKDLENQAPLLDFGNLTLERIPAIRRLLQKNFKMISNGMKNNNSIHGAAAEANVSEYMRYFAGHKISAKDGIEIPSMFNLGENPYAISNFIGKNTKATKDFSFERLGLAHGDFALNPSNGINGICIDMGGIMPVGNKIIGNKEATRILKTIQNTPASERGNVLESIRTNLINKGYSGKSIDFLNQIETIVIK